MSPTESTVGVDRRCRASVSSVGVVRSVSSVGVGRSVSSVGVGRSVSTVGVVRRHRPSASAVGEHRRALRKASFSHGAKRKFAEFGLL
jgi:hypothetical protein